jgi:hypothetical protein
LLDFNKIWECQKLPGEIFDVLSVIAENIYKSITNPAGGNANISQWAKKKECWDAIKALKLNFSLDEKFITSKQNVNYEKKESKKLKVLDKGIEIQAFVINIDPASKHNLLEYYESHLEDTTPKKIDVLRKYVAKRIILPSEGQAKIIYDLYLTAEKAGVELNNLKPR